MIHLFKQKNGKFDVAFILKGKYIMGSNQNYERKRSAYNAIKLLAKHSGYPIKFQDDSEPVPPVFSMYPDNIKMIRLTEKPKKKYVPNNKKK